MFHLQKDNEERSFEKILDDITQNIFVGQQILTTCTTFFVAMKQSNCIKMLAVLQSETPFLLLSDSSGAQY